MFLLKPGGLTALLCASFMGMAQAADGLDRSAMGPIAVDVLAFPDLVDATTGRAVPIKLHLPRGDRPLPVLFISHGAGGSWDANYKQAQHLASHGYAVLALEHPGSNTQVLMQGGRPGANLRAMTRDAAEVLGRPRDVHFAIDQAQAWNRSHDSLRGRLSTDRVGVMGHSYGAYTTLVVGGMRPALDWLEPAQTPARGLGPDLSDPRMACGVALSPQGPGEPFFIDASYATLRVPLLAISGSLDRQQTAPPENRRRAFTLWPPGDKTLVWLNNADHGAFSDPSGSARRGLPSPSRADAQALVRAATLAFFDACLKADTAARAVLTEEGLRPYLRGRIDGLEVLIK